MRAALLAIALTACSFGGEDHTRGAYPVAERYPVCKLKKEAPAEARSRDEMNMAWKQRHDLDVAWVTGLQALGHDLGIAPADADVPVVVKALEDQAIKLIGEGCAPHVSYVEPLTYKLGCVGAQGEVKTDRDRMQGIVDHRVIPLIALTERYSKLKVEHSEATFAGDDCYSVLGRMDAMYFGFAARTALTGGANAKTCSAENLNACLTACLADDYEGCQAVANDYQAKNDKAATLRYNERACHLAIQYGGPTYSCSAVLSAYAYPGPAYDPARAMSVIDEACTVNPDGEACATLPIQLLGSKSAHVPKDLAQKTGERLEKLCSTSKKGDVCYLQLAAQTGPLKADKAVIEASADRVCEFDVNFCAPALMELERVDHAGAAERATRRCDADAKVCGSYAHVFARTDMPRAIEFAQKTCDADIVHCMDLALLYELGVPGTHPPNKHKAHDVWAKMCAGQPEGARDYACKKAEELK